MNRKRTALAVAVERGKGRKQFCAFSARARFHTGWANSDLRRSPPLRRCWAMADIKMKRPWPIRAGDFVGHHQQETAPLPTPFLVHLAWTGPLRLALAGATRSGTAGVGHLLAIR
jgi:hypothetical protein